MTAAEADFRGPGSRAGAGPTKPDAGMETGPDWEVILTLDHGVLLMHDPRAAEAAYIDEIFEKARRRQVRTIRTARPSGTPCRAEAEVPEVGQRVERRRHSHCRAFAVPVVRSSYSFVRC